MQYSYTNELNNHQFSLDEIMSVAKYISAV